MRKLFTLALMFMLSTGMVFAQVQPVTDANITQSDDDNQADITQIADMDAVGSGTPTALSNVTQSGEDNRATVLQDLTAVTGTAGLIESKIVQAGDRNRAEQTQGEWGPNFYGNYMESIQSGDDNRSIQAQKKLGNDAYVRQSGDRNRAEQQQDMDESVFDGTNHIADINQSGNDNQAKQLQDGFGGEAYATQSGDRNRVVQNQADVGNAYVSATQSGDDNRADQEQTGRRSWADIRQQSDDNRAYQSQEVTTDVLPQGPYVNTAEIIQRGGDGNYAMQSQYEAWTPGGDEPDNFARILQDGHDNHATQMQFGLDNTSNVVQTGNSGQASVCQTTIGSGC